MDQETRKISAAQLAEVLAKVDQKGGRTDRVSGEVEARPAVTPEGPPQPSVEAPRADADAPPVSAPPQVLAVVERPVGDRKVVNVTSAEAPSSAPRLAVGESDSQSDSQSDSRSEPPETSAARAIVPPTSSLEDAEARQIIEAGHGAATMKNAILVVALFVVGCVALVWANH
jgi:hypothetical protein